MRLSTAFVLVQVFCLGTSLRLPFSVRSLKINQNRNADVSSPQRLVSRYNLPIQRKHKKLASLNMMSFSPLYEPLKKRDIEWLIWSVLSIASSLGIYLERTKIGAMLSSPLITMGITLTLCNLGILPSASPVYSIVHKVLVPMAVPLLLLDADLRKCIRSTGSLFKAFIVGSVGTILGTIIAYALVPMTNLKGADKIAAALCARHIGGAVNFVAVSDILQTSPELVAAALAADNVVVALYFAFLFYISKPGEAPVVSSSSGGKSGEGSGEDSGDESFTGEISSSVDEPITPIVPIIAGDEPQKAGVTLNSLSMALSVALAICSFSHVVHSLFFVSPILVSSILAVLLATLYPKVMGQVSEAGGVVGVLFMQFFFAVTGAMGHIPTVLSIAPALFLHTSIQIIVHFLVTIGIGRSMNIPLRELVLASNANVGGPTTAAGMAANKNWRSLVLPALLTGIFGYAIATGVGVVMAKLVLPLMVRRPF